MKEPQKEWRMAFLYLLSVVVYMVAMTIIGIGNAGDNIRYVVFAVAIGYGFVELFVQRKILTVKFKNDYGKEIQGIYFIAALFYLLSAWQAHKVGRALGSRTYVQIALLLIPAMYSYCLINLLSPKTIQRLFQITLCCTVVFYIYEQGILHFFCPSNWLSISFSSSYCPFESSTYAGLFLALYIYYYYAVNERKDRSISNLVAYGVSFAGALVTFKRLAVVFVLCLFLFGRFIDFRKKIPRALPGVTAVAFTVGTVYYTQFMQGTLNIFNIDVYKFSMGRDYILSLWAKYDYLSYGYGSSFELIGRYLEMDLVQIYLEIGAFALLAFSWCYFRIAKRNLYAYLIMLFAFANMLTASSIPMPLDWTLMLLVIAGIASGKFEKIEPEKT